MFWLAAFALAAAPQSAPAQEPLSFGRHYLHALKGEAVGSSLGFGVGLAGSLIIGDVGPLAVALPLGNTVGTAMGANLATETDEANGSFFAAWTGGIIGGTAAAFAAYEVGNVLSGSEEGGSATAAVLGIIGWSLGSPLVSTAAQRWFRTDNAPDVSLWSPSGRYQESMGLRMKWRLP